MTKPMFVVFVGTAVAEDESFSSAQLGCEVCRRKNLSALGNASIVINGFRLTDKCAAGD